MRRRDTAGAVIPPSILVKPTDARCNLACTYCFYSKKSELYPHSRVMSSEVLEAMVSQFLEMTTYQASFNWQGGEPLLAGLEFYKEAVRLQKRNRRGQHVANAFQTNGTLLNEEWASFFKKNDFLVGISLDGPRRFHDFYRRTRSGSPTFDRVMDAISVLRAHRVQFNVLCVVNDQNVGHPEELYRFFVDMGIRYLQFVPCLEWDESAGRPYPFSVDPESYGEFLCRLFDLWKEDFPNVYIRFFNSVLSTRLGGETGLCMLAPRCGSYVVIENNGDVYPCDFFVEPQLRLGNLLETHLRQIVESSAFLRFAEAKEKLPRECLECRWLDQCFGGCQYHRRGGLRRTYFCESYRKFFSHSEQGFRELESRL